MMDIFSFFDLPPLETLETKDSGMTETPGAERSLPSESMPTDAATWAAQQASDPTATTDSTADDGNDSPHPVFWMLP